MITLFHVKQKTKPVRDKRILQRVRRLACCSCGRFPTDEVPNRAHHATGMGKGKGTKNGDDLTMPLCDQCHTEFHDLSGHFKDWDRERLREWQSQMVVRTHGTLTGDPSRPLYFNQ